MENIVLVMSLWDIFLLNLFCLLQQCHFFMMLIMVAITIFTASGSFCLQCHIRWRTILSILEMWWWCWCSVVNLSWFNCCSFLLLFPNGSSFHMQSLKPIIKLLLKHNSDKWLAICQKRMLGKIRKLKLSCLSLFFGSWAIFSSFCICLHIFTYIMQIRSISILQMAYVMQFFILPLLINSYKLF